MKRSFLAIAIAALWAASGSAAADGTFAFVDASGNTIADGATVTCNKLVDDEFLGRYISTGLYVKNTTGSKAAGVVLLDVNNMPNGHVQICCFGNCVSQDKPGNYYSAKSFMEAGATEDLQAEWFPTEKATWTATLQLATVETTTNVAGILTFGKVKDLGPKVNVVWSYSDSLKGDINGDGTVNVTDVTTLINGILGTAQVDTSVGDVDGNGMVNVSDVTALINIILAAS